MHITFTEGWYNIRGNAVNVGGMSFELVEDFKVGKDGEGYVTVDGSSQAGFPARNIRIKCRQGGYVTGSSQLSRIPEGVSMLKALKQSADAKHMDFTQKQSSGRSCSRRN